MSHQITQPLTARLAEWYLLELGVSAAVAGLAVVFIPGAITLALVPLAAIGAQEVERLGNNTRVRLAARKRIRKHAAAVEQEHNAEVA